MRNLLILSPIQAERQAIAAYCEAQGLRAEAGQIGCAPVALIPKLRLTLAKGGFGKVQFAVTTRYLLDCKPDWEAVICAGAAGSLVDGVTPGDVVVGVTTIEHDFRQHFAARRPPAYAAAPTLLDALCRIHAPTGAFTVHFGGIASGDEDVAGDARRREIHAATGALAVAWEGIGGAKACAFSQTPFIEIRGITDTARGDVPAAFKANLRRAMTHVATVILELAHHL